MNLREFVKQQEFKRGSYEVSTLLHGQPDRYPLLTFELVADDESGARHVPLRMSLASELLPVEKDLVFSALVRAGVQHPGLRDEDLARLHRQAREHRHIELFTDLNALTTGLLSHLVRSLGRRVSRVVISSSSIDVLHEYQSKIEKPGNGNRRLYWKRNEMARALRVLDEIRHAVPTHIHQLTPGSTRYFHRYGAGPSNSDPSQQGDVEELTYVSEDRQMISAYWDYLGRSNPRLPLYLITSDFALAHVCAAERVPFLFAQSPHAVWKDEGSFSPQALWFDPFALSLRPCLPHSILWELCLVFSQLNVRRLDESPDSASHFSLGYDVRRHSPGQVERIERGTLLEPSPAAAANKPASPQTKSPSTKRPKKEETPKLQLTTLVEILPTSPEQRIPVSSFSRQEPDALEQMRLIGETTELWRVEGEHVVAGSSLQELLDSLSGRDYLAVNSLFLRYAPYSKVLEKLEAGKSLTDKEGGMLRQWAINLGAAYNSTSGILYGLRAVSDEEFSQAVARLHAELATDAASVPLPDILDRVCLELRLSPIRFEALLNQTLGTGALKEFEAQRATVDRPLKPHQVLVAPTVPSGYLRKLEPGRGIVLNSTLVSTLVRRPGAL